MEFEKRLRSEKGDATMATFAYGSIMVFGLVMIYEHVSGVDRKIDRLENEIKQERNISEKNIPNSNVTQVTQADLTPFIVNPQ